MDYSDQQAAELYDTLNPWDESDQFYLDRVLAAGDVLDVGCGTGAVLRRAAHAGHYGRLVGVDPDPDALAVARGETRVDWVDAVAATLPFESEFDLVIMGGNAFQCLLSDAEVDASLRAMRQTLREGGTVVFNSRNPDARRWESWTPAFATDATDPDGLAVRVVHDLVEVIDEPGSTRVTFTETTQNVAGEALRTDQATLRFLGAAQIAAALEDAGFTVTEQLGNWDGAAVSAGAPNIITTATAV